MSVTGIILAGGKSSRMGSDKGWVLFKEIPFIHHVIKNITPLCSEILISANSPRYETLGYRVVYDQVKEIGPLAGITAALKQASNETCLILSCDLPLAGTQLLQMMITYKLSHDIVVPKVGDYVQPLCGVYSKSLANKFDDEIQAGNYGMQYLLKKYKAKVLKANYFQGINIDLELTNFNSKSDLDDFIKKNKSQNEG